MKRFTAIALCVLMLVSMLPMAAFSASISDNAQQIVNVGGKASTDDGRINISKTVAKTDKENYFDITLTADQQMPSTDIVLVMDISNTMNYDHYDNKNNVPEQDKRITKAKNAAKEFLNDYKKASDAGSECRIGMVQFNSHASKVFDLGDINENINTFTDKIDKVEAPGGTWRFTNIEAGLQLAYNMLNHDSEAEQKYVILITDGFPTTYIESGRNDLNTIKGYDVSYKEISYTPTQQTDGLFYDFVINKVCNGTSYSDTGAIRARTVANKMKNDNINIFSIGVDVSNDSQTVQYHVDRVGSSMSIVERTGTTYEVGSATDSKAYINWLGTGIGGGKNLSEVGVTNAFANGDTTDNLGEAFDTVLSYVIGSSPMKATDPMGDNIEFLGFYNQKGQLVDSVSGTHTQDAENTASFSNEIFWDINASGYTEGLNENRKPMRSYSITYRVRLKNEANGFIEKSPCNTNGTTELIYDVVDAGKLEEKTLNYKLPSVQGYLAELSFVKTDKDNGNKLSGAEFKLSHNEATCSVCAGDAAISDFTATSGSDGKFVFSKVPSGHEYTLEETQSPAGYVKNSNKYSVKVAYDSIIINNNDVNEGELFKIENKAFVPAEINLNGTKTLTGGGKDNSKIQKDQFSFEINHNHNNGVAGVLEKVNVNAGGEINFGTWIFTIPGPYSFTITETDLNKAGYKYDNAEYSVNVEVTVDSSGEKLEAETKIKKDNSAADSIIFENTYTAPDPVNTPLNGNKGLAEVDSDNNRIEKEIKENQFFVSIKSDENNDTSGIQNFTPSTVPVATDGSFAFDDIVFIKAGTYSFIITEDNKGAAGYDYDNSIYVITYTVTLDETNNTLKISETVTKDGQPVDEIKFENIYNTPKPVELPVPGITTLSGGDPANTKTNDDITDGFFSYVITGGDQNGVSDVPDTAKSQQGGKLDFGTWKFDKVGTYNFTITENTPPAGYSDETGKVDMTVVVTLNEKTNTLETSVTISTGEIIKIDNLYVAPAPVDTPLDGDKGLTEVDSNKNKEFEKEIKENQFFVSIKSDENNDVNGIPEFKPSTVPVATDGSFAFDDIIFIKAGTYSFIITEDNKGAAGYDYDNSIYVITYTVTLDETDNTLKISETVTKDGQPVDEIKFENIYNTPKPVELPVPGITTLSGGESANTKTNDDITDGFFSYVITGGDQNGVSDVPDTAKSQQGGKLNFGTWKFDKVGTYNFTISENTPPAGYSDETGKVDMTVDVTLNEKTNTLETSVTISTGEIIKIDNLYTAPLPIEIALDGTKTLSGHKSDNDIAAEDFTFTVSADSSNNPDGFIGFAETASVADGGLIDFGSATFLAAGIYKFTVTEDDSKKIGYYYDESSYTVTVTVTLDESTNTLSSVTEIEKDGEKAEEIIFNNVYIPNSAHVKVYARKDVEGKPQKVEKFSFIFTALDEGNPMPDGAETLTIQKLGRNEGYIYFGKIEFTKAGTYSYTISEINDGKEGYTYDTSIYTVTYTITDNGGNLESEMSITLNGEKVDEALFTNIYNLEDKNAPTNSEESTTDTSPEETESPAGNETPGANDSNEPSTEPPEETTAVSSETEPATNDNESDADNSIDFPLTGSKNSAAWLTMFGISFCAVAAVALKKRKETD